MNSSNNMDGGTHWPWRVKRPALHNEHRIPIAVDTDTAPRPLPDKLLRTDATSAKAATSIKSVVRGRWKFVNRASTTLNSNPGLINNRLLPGEERCHRPCDLSHCFKRSNHRRANGDHAGGPFVLSA